MILFIKALLLMLLVCTNKPVHFKIEHLHLSLLHTYADLAFTEAQLNIYDISWQTLLF